MNIKSTVLRYIVPFTFDLDFNEAFKRVDSYIGNTNSRYSENGDKASIWDRRVLDNGESDLYDYIKDEFYMGKGSDNQTNKVGCLWLLNENEKNKNGNSKAIENNFYWVDGNIHKIMLNNIGLYLFRNGLGFFWYEMDVKELASDFDSLVKFQNIFKELNKNEARNSAGLWIKSHYNDAFIKTVDSDKKDLFLIPISLGDWVNNILCNTLQTKVSYVAGRNNSFNKTSIVGKINKFKSYDNLKVEELDWENRVFDDLNGSVADKAVLFSYISANKQEELNKCMLDDKKKEYIYHLTNGYKESYTYCPKIGENIYESFGNFAWYATSEGCSMINWPYEVDKSNSSSMYNNAGFLQGKFANKVRRDYFHLYIKALYQSYSLLLFSKQVQNNLSALRDIYSEIHSNTEDKEAIELNRDEINKLSININLFLTKNVTTSVSHIDHQNEFYNYVVHCLRIDDECKSVLTGLTAINEIVAKQNEEDIKKYQEEEKSFREKEKEVENDRNERVQAVIGSLVIFQSVSMFPEWRATCINYNFPNAALVLGWMIIFLVLLFSFYVFGKAIKQVFISVFSFLMEKIEKCSKNKEVAKYTSVFIILAVIVLAVYVSYLFSVSLPLPVAE